MLKSIAITDETGKELGEVKYGTYCRRASGIDIRAGAALMAGAIAGTTGPRADPLKNGCRTFPSADFARYSISASSFGSTQMPLMRDPLGIGLGLPDQRLQPLLQVLGRGLVEAVVDLACIDQIVALAPAEIDAVQLAAIEREAGDRQSLPLRAGLLHPVVAAPGRVEAVPHLRDDAFQADLASVRVHLLAIDLEALAELESVSAMIFFSCALRSNQRQLPQIVAVKVEQIEGDQHDLVDLPLSSFCSTEKSVVPSAAGTTTSPSMIAEPALMCQASAAIFLKRLVQSWPRRVKIFTASLADELGPGSRRT